jgi:hypothetical protein
VFGRPSGLGWIDELSAATGEGRLRHVLALYTHPHVLVIAMRGDTYRRCSAHMMV